MANSHKRDTDARSTTPASSVTPDDLAPRSPRPRRRAPRAALVAAPLAVAATLATVTLGVATGDVEQRASLSLQGTLLDVTESRSVAVSRSAERLSPAERRAERQRERREDERLQRIFDRLADRVATQRAIERADERLWTTVELNLWTAPGEDARKVGLLEERERVLVTGRRAAGRVEVVVAGKARWVTEGYLAEEKPEREVAAGGTSPAAAECTNGTSVSPGVSPNIVAVHRATCANFPEITTYGDFRSDGEHAQGIAVDIMVSGERGWQVAEYLRANYSELGINYLIYSQRIWSVDRASEGWRPMEDRGSVTANHYDHVHVTTY